MNKAIITGANGFVGSALVHELVNRNIHVVAVVRSQNSNIEKIRNLKNLEIIYCNQNEIYQLERLLTDRDYDVFYHFAWDGSAGNARTDLELQNENISAIEECVKIASLLGCKKFVGAGSIMELETIAATYTNESRPGLAYIYGNAKVSAHSVSKCTAANLNIEHVWGMITNAYGPGEISDRFINTTLRKIISNEPLKFTSGIQNYDFVYISDVAQAFYLLGEYGKPFYNYIIGSGESKQLKEFVKEMCLTLSPNSNLLFGDIPFTGINIPLESFSIKLLMDHTNFKPQVNFRTGILNTYHWLKEENK